MSSSRFTAPLLILLAFGLALGCTPRRGGGGGGGGNPDDPASGAETGQGKNVGSADSGTSFAAGEGSSTLYIVNTTGSRIMSVNGWECMEQQWFGAPDSFVLEDGAYATVSGLLGSCWSFEAWSGDESFYDHSTDGLEGEYTWVLESRATGDDDDATDDDDDPEANVSVYNYSEYDFFELVVANVGEVLDLEGLCSPFNVEDRCTTAASGTVGFVAFMQEGRLDNNDNCFMASEAITISPGQEMVYEFTGGQLDCELP